MEVQNQPKSRLIMRMGMEINGRCYFSIPPTLLQFQRDGYRNHIHHSVQWANRYSIITVEQGKTLTQLCTQPEDSTREKKAKSQHHCTIFCLFLRAFVIIWETTTLLGLSVPQQQWILEQNISSNNTLVFTSAVGYAAWSTRSIFYTVPERLRLSLYQSIPQLDLVTS